MSKLVGILNITPDSFSDGGRYALADAALRRYAELAAEGADIVDLGAESTRPGAAAISAEEEWARLEPVLSALDFRVPVSVDTRHASVAEKALRMGAAILNDQSGLGDPAMGALLAETQHPIVVMHAMTLPVDPTVRWEKHIDPVEAILRWKESVTERAAKHGIAPERLIYDPGIGFGKWPEQSLALINRAPELLKSGGKWLYGHSRKSFLTLLTDASPEGRDRWTCTLSQWLAHCGVDYLRVHDVKGHRACM